MPRDHRAAQPYWPHSQPEPAPETEAPDAPPCPGKCNSAWRAAEKRVTLHGGEHDLEPEPGQPVWCPPCTTEIRGALTDWPDLATRLHDEIESGVKTRIGEFVSGSKTRPIHEHEAPSLLLDEMAEWLPEWAATIAKHRGLPERPGRRPGVSAHADIDSACRFLLIHLDWHLAARPEEERELAEGFGDELLRATRKARILTGTQEAEPVRVVGVPCPHCDRKALEHEIEDSATRRGTVSKYVYGDDGDVRIGQRPVDEHEAETLRLRPPKDADPDAYEPTVPARLTETTPAVMAGANTGYIRCRRCKPVFRMTMDDYHRWTRLLAAGDQVRAMATADKLREVFGNSIPAQYRTSA
jgi:hypothetical protein